MKYNVNYFIKKFEAIPEDKWCTHTLNNKHGRCCAQGHCGITNENLRDRSIKGSECKTLIDIFGRDQDMTLTIARINNGVDSRYLQPTPKQRILAALYDIKRMQKPEVFEQEFIPITLKRILKEETKLIGAS